VAASVVRAGAVVDRGQELGQVLGPDRFAFRALEAFPGAGALVGVALQKADAAVGALRQRDPGVVDPVAGGAVRGAVFEEKEDEPGAEFPAFDAEAALPEERDLLAALSHTGSLPPGCCRFNPLE